jgi:hypothetical protein
MKYVLFYTAFCFVFSNAVAQWQHATNPAYVYYNSGNVGIGVTSPGYRLSLYANENQTTLGANTQSVFRLMNGYAEAFGRRSELQFALTESPNDVIAVVAAEYSSWNNDVAGDLIFGTSPTNSTTVHERMRIKHNGDIQIGNPAPYTSGTYYLTMPAGSGTINEGHGRNFVITAGSSDNNSAAHGGYLYLRPGIPTAPSNNYGNVILADEGGKVGVGTINPVWTFDVNGPIASLGQAVIHGTSTSIDIGDISGGDGYRDKLNFYTRT